MRQYFFLLLLIGMGSAASAQVYLPGKLVTADGDTLEGLVAEQGGITFGYRKDKNAPERIYQRKEVVAYVRKDEHFEEHTVEVLRGKFPERVKDYLTVKVEGQVRLLQYEGKAILGGEYIGLYLHEHGMEMPQRVNMDPGNFRKQMSVYFGDYAELAARIKSKELTYANTEEIVKLYNAWYAQQDHSDEAQPQPKPEKAKKEKAPKSQPMEREAEDKEQ